MASDCVRKSIIVCWIAASCLIVGSVSARAAGITCPPLIGSNPPIADNVNPSTGCEIGSTNTDFHGADLTLFQVNLDGIFGFSDWEFAGKVIETESGSIDIGLSATGGSISGTWSVDDDLWTRISDLMLVFKGGVPKDPGHYVSYLIADGATSGAYITPFWTPTGRGGAADTSHISAYVRMGTVSSSSTTTSTTTGGFPDTTTTTTDTGGFPDTTTTTTDTGGFPDTTTTTTDTGGFPDTTGGIGNGTGSVPEPASLFLLGGGLAMLARARHRKRNR